MTHQDPTMPLGSCTLVGAGPGDPELLTLKAVKAIQAATVLFVDDLVNDAVLAWARPSEPPMPEPVVLIELPPEAALAVKASDPAGAGMSLFHTSDLKALVDAVLGYLREGDLVLAKASRGLALERFTDALFAAGLVNAPDRDAKTGAAAPKGGAHAS